MRPEWMPDIFDVVGAGADGLRASGSSTASGADTEVIPVVPSSPCCVALADQASRKEVCFSERDEDVVKIVSDDWVFSKQVIPRARVHRSYGVAMEDYEKQAWRSYAEARRRAIDLAYAGGRIDDVHDMGDWEGVARAGGNYVLRLPRSRREPRADACQLR